jgi:hypothetical protein
MHSDPHLTGRGMNLREVDDLEHLRTAELDYSDSSHGISPSTRPNFAADPGSPRSP